MPMNPILKHTLLSTCFIGYGHFKLGSKRWALGLALGFYGLFILSLIHLLWGISLFESNIGSFAFGIVLRSLLIVWIFSPLDSYLRAIFNSSPEKETIAAQTQRRAAVFFNLLLPGLGYLWVKAWLRFLSSFLLLFFILFLAKKTSRYIDIAYVAFQLIIAFGIYFHLITIERDKNDGQLPLLPYVKHLFGAQLTLLLLGSVAALLFFFTVNIRMLDTDKFRIGKNNIIYQKSNSHIHLNLKKKALEFDLFGKGWKLLDRGAAILRARHKDGISLMLAMQPIYPFIRENRYIEGINKNVHAEGYFLKNKKELMLNGSQATQLHFEKKISDIVLDKWILIVPRYQRAYVLIFSCSRSNCQKLEHTLEKSRDSLKLGNDA